MMAKQHVQRAGSRLAAHRQPMLLENVPSDRRGTMTPCSRAGNVQRTLALLGKRRSLRMSNPKTKPTDNTEKDPDQWVSGDDPMTGAQASYLKTLCEQAGTPDVFQDDLTKAEASKLIDEMREKASV